MEDNDNSPSVSATPAMPGDSHIYLSPVITGLAEDSRPNPLPACGTCPAAIWFVASEKLQCFCSRMHLIVWSKKDAPVMKCDGREQAIEAMLKEAHRDR